ncbi:MAG: excalibur calcium-binding domain-containing protein [Albidovulum sp.]|uniref:excalibur calcium-binding domain-containing protein n=1 Tax=Albidovulum sp. TaxID=1872424 RepID=UPI003C8FD078
MPRYPATMTDHAHPRRHKTGRGDRRKPGMGRFLSSVILKLMAIPVVALAMAVSVYIRTSPYPPSSALAHLLARAGCPAAAAIGLAEARVGEVGYHARNDPDGDGIACAPVPVPEGLATPGQVTVTKAGGAKFVRPKPAEGG